jgi:tetratricopeptide (TPR) repeat protein
LVLFERAIQLDPALADAYVGVGAVYANQWFYGWGGQTSLDKAAANFEKALALRPGLRVAQRGLIGDRFERCRPLEALELGQQGVSRGTDDIEATMTRGVACVFGGLPGKATQLFEHVIELDPENAGAHFFSTFSHVWAGRLPEAIRSGDDFLRKFGDDPEIHIWMGVANHGLGHMKVARAHFTTAIELFTEDNATYVYLFAGHFERSAGQLPEARRLWETGARIVREKLAASPDNTRMKFFLLSYLAALGEAEEAKKLAPSLSGWWVGDCAALGQLGEVEACVSCLEAAMQSQTALVALLIIHYPFSFGLETVARTPGFQRLQEEHTRQVERYEAIY